MFLVENFQNEDSQLSLQSRTSSDSGQFFASRKRYALYIFFGNQRIQWSDDSRMSSFQNTSTDKIAFFFLKKEREKKRKQTQIVVESRPPSASTARLTKLHLI